MKNLYNSADYQDIVTRINRLTPSTKARYGSMTSNQMICHISDWLRDSLRMREHDSRYPGWLQKMMKLYLFSPMPIPRYYKTFRPYSQRPNGGGTRPTTFEQDRATFLDLLNAYASLDEDYSMPRQPVAGQLGRTEHGALLYKHFDHHLTQFGV